MIFQNYAEHLGWRANPGDGVANVGDNGTTHWVVAVNPTKEEVERLTRHGAELYIMPEADAVEIDGKDWYNEEAEIIDLPPSARRLRRPPTA